MSQAVEKSFDELTLGESVLLEDLVDRDALGEMAKSFFDLFRIPLKMFSESGILLADASEPQALYVYLSGLRKARGTLQDVVGAVKAISLEVRFGQRPKAKHVAPWHKLPVVKTRRAAAAAS